MFPTYSYNCLYLKLQEISKNIFLNDFFYKKLETVPTEKNKEVMRNFLRLNFTLYEDNYDQVKVRKMININPI